ncbi:tagaturonate reductase [Acetatifactor muris]|uniref:Altronate oxidoreductase n=1 Tax=Acetatifactor muris TaxID=879566 RepID=A0A2K4ZMG2_9FIRM|nr:tagaturonate reductase [Acetatifactor muris]MCR2049971.1 tagaturonate reductase [Acetatifactor muris]SOY31679.1 Altronate oxidoreductase [Acetatifactor muris]
MEILNKAMTNKKERPIRVVQFGEGNFLRAFVDYMIDIANEQGKFDGDIVLIKPISFGSLDSFHRQDCQYTVSLRGMVDGEAKILNRQVTSVADAVDAYEEYDKYMGLAEIDTLRFVVSNTTEAGIVYDAEDKFELNPPKSFPGKLTKFLYHRYETFQGDMDKGLVMLPVELIDDNGIMLKKCVMQLIELWNLGGEFRTWVEEACVFTSTLVDRIVTGYPRDTIEEEWKALGYEDRILVTGEPFALWVIESPKDISGELPLPEAGLPVIFTDNQKPYKQRKVRILNGAHTSFVLASYLCGNDIVKQSMEDDDIRNFMTKIIFDEVIPTLTLPEEELKEFAEAVITRFNNPYVKHALLSISLNSVSKWRARCMPSLLGYVEKFGKLPAHLTFSLAALMAFYHGTEIRDKALIGHRDGQEYNILDDMEVLEFFRDNCEKDSRVFVESFLGNESFFGQNLNQVAGLTDAVTAYLEDIKTNGMRAALCKIS